MKHIPTVSLEEAGPLIKLPNRYTTGMFSIPIQQRHRTTPRGEQSWQVKP